MENVLYISLWKQPGNWGQLGQVVSWGSHPTGYRTRWFHPDNRPPVLVLPPGFSRIVICELYRQHAVHWKARTVLLCRIGCTYLGTGIFVTEHVLWKRYKMVLHQTQRRVNLGEFRWMKPGGLERPRKAYSYFVYQTFIKGNYIEILRVFKVGTSLDVSVNRSHLIFYISSLLNAYDCELFCIYAYIGLILEWALLNSL
jgi:hypothetical protein